MEAIIKALQQRQSMQLPSVKTRETVLPPVEVGGKSVAAANDDGDMVYRCYHPGCNKVFKSLRNLTNHRKIHDGERGAKDSSAETQRRKYPCTFPGCTKVFLTSFGLSKHRRSHEKNQTLHVCPQCSKEFKTKEVESGGRSGRVGSDVARQEQTHEGSEVYVRPAELQRIVRSEE